MTTEMSDRLLARQVQAILSQHGAPSYVAADGQVIGMMAWCRREPDGRMVSGTTWEPVGMTLRAVRRAVVDAGDLARAMQDVTHGMEPFDKRKRLEARREMEAELRQAERLALVPVPRSEGMARREPVSVRRPQFGGWRVG